MARYIDADIFIHNICRMGVKALGEFKICDVKKVADETPTADVKEVVRGEWIEKERHCGGFRTVTVTHAGIFGNEIKTTGQVDERYTCKRNYCSVCGKVEGEFTNFCGYCGSDNRGVK